MAKAEIMYGNHPISSGPWNPSTRNGHTLPWPATDDTYPSDGSFAEPPGASAYENRAYRGSSATQHYPASHFGTPGSSRSPTSNVNTWSAGLVPAATTSSAYRPRPSSGVFGGSVIGGLGSWTSPNPSTWEGIEDLSPSNSVDDIITSPNLSDYSLENSASAAGGKQAKTQGKGRSQRRPNNRDEFDGPHQFLQRPHPEVIALQERELPHLPTNLLVQEQDHVLSQVNARLSQCAYDFVAKYQFPIPLTQEMRPVERAQDREWTEWVYLLKRLATKRRIPARVLYNGQIKQFVTVLENSLEMRHAAKNQSRPLKDDRNILQLISAGIQVAKILKDATAMEHLDHLYVSTEKQIAERAATRYRQ